MNRTIVTASDYSDGVYASAEAATQSGEDVPTGYMGANAWLYKGSTLVYSSGWVYNDQSRERVYAHTSTDYDSGSYYADGQTKAYYGNGYYTYDAFQSPIVQY
jgi:hypothetical protein